MKRCVLLLLVAVLLLGSCASAGKPHQITYLNLFDTVTTLLCYSGTASDFRENAQIIYDGLYRYHRLFDIYNEYEGIHNLKTVNDHAGISPVTVDSAIIELLLDCKAYYALTDGKVNAAMGSVLRLWHEARQESLADPANAYLPDRSQLSLAAAHMDFDNVLIDEAASTVYITDPMISLDVGAIAKGWACQQVARSAPEGMLLSVGGNVCATGAKDTRGNPWVIGIQNPDDGDSYLHTIHLTSGAVDTSGDYQRAYAVSGQRYHHIIDPETQMPAPYWRSVTVVCADSGLADALSTALFLLPQQEGQALLEKSGAEAMWVDGNGEIYYSPGFQQYIRT